jgi:hypothetical protein
MPARSPPICGSALSLDLGGEGNEIRLEHS